MFSGGSSLETVTIHGGNTPTPVSNASTPLPPATAPTPTALRRTQDGGNHDSNNSSSKNNSDPSVSSGLTTSSQSSTANSMERLECDYDVRPTPLYKYIQSRQWSKVLQIIDNPDYSIQASVWVVRKEPTGQLRWRLLPLHAALIFQAPHAVIEGLLRVDPAAAAAKDDQGMVPLHLALRNTPIPWSVVEELLNVHPAAVTAQDRKGRTPLQGAASLLQKMKLEQQHQQLQQQQQQLGTVPASSNASCATNQSTLANASTTSAAAALLSPNNNTVSVDDAHLDNKAALRVLQLYTKFVIAADRNQQKKAEEVKKEQSSTVPSPSLQLAAQLSQQHAKQLHELQLELDAEREQWKNKLESVELELQQRLAQATQREQSLVQAVDILQKKLQQANQTISAASHSLTHSVALSPRKQLAWTQLPAHNKTKMTTTMASPRHGDQPECVMSLPTDEQEDHELATCNQMESPRKELSALINFNNNQMVALSPRTNNNQHTTSQHSDKNYLTWVQELEEENVHLKKSVEDLLEQQEHLVTSFDQMMAEQTERAQAQQQLLEKQQHLTQEAMANRTAHVAVWKSQLRSMQTSIRERLLQVGLTDSVSQDENKNVEASSKENIPEAGGSQDDGGANIEKDITDPTISSNSMAYDEEDEDDVDDENNIKVSKNVVKVEMAQRSYQKIANNYTPMDDAATALASGSVRKALPTGDPVFTSRGHSPDEPANDDKCKEEEERGVGYNGHDDDPLFSGSHENIEVDDEADVDSVHRSVMYRLPVQKKLVEGESYSLICRSTSSGSVFDEIDDEDHHNHQQEDTRFHFNEAAGFQHTSNYSQSPVAYTKHRSKRGNSTTIIVVQKASSD